MTYTPDQIDATMKQLYSGRRPENMACQRYPTLMKMKKVGGFTGSNMKVPIYTGFGGGSSGTIGNAIANASQSSRAAFILTRAQRFAVLQIGAETIYAADGNKGSFVKELKREGDHKIKLMGKDSAFELMGDGTGVLGTVASYSGADPYVITLSNARDTRKFNIGQVISEDGLPTAGGWTATIEKIDSVAGTITTVSAPSGGTPAGSDSIYTDGDANSRVAQGIGAWIPHAAPTSTPFFGVDRTVHPQYLAGHRQTLGGVGIGENYIRLNEDIGDAGGNPDYGVLSHKNFAKLCIEEEQKAQTEQPAKGATVGFQFVTIQTSTGPMKIYPDPSCPDNRGYSLTMADWEIRYMGPGFPHMVKDDNNTGLRGALTDSLEQRFRQWWQPACYAPGHQGVFSI